MRFACILLIMLMALPAQAIDLRVSDRWIHALATNTPQKPAGELSEGEKIKVLRKIHLKYAAVDYIPDIENYGVEEYWATREEMEKHGGGDCDDFALAKYFDLLEAGIKDSDMKITIIYNGQMHAILVVTAGGKKYALDNQNPLQIIDMKKIRGVVLYEANQSGERWYADGKKILKERAVASPLRWKQ